MSWFPNKYDFHRRYRINQIKSSGCSFSLVTGGISISSGTSSGNLDLTLFCWLSVHVTSAVGNFQSWRA